jgi:hypothetical protein
MHTVAYTWREGKQRHRLSIPCVVRVQVLFAYLFVFKIRIHFHSSTMLNIPNCFCRRINGGGQILALKSGYLHPSTIMADFW